MIIFNVDVMLARRKMSLTELSERVGITMANLSILKTGRRWWRQSTQRIPSQIIAWSRSWNVRIAGMTP